jgi:hypothetical protein
LLSAVWDCRAGNISEGDLARKGSDNLATACFDGTKGADPIVHWVGY